MKQHYLISSELVAVAYIAGVAFFIDTDTSQVKGIAGETPTSLLQNSSRNFPKVARLC
jgi:hypothetical protein